MQRGRGFGFQIGRKPTTNLQAVPPPPSLGVSKQGYSTMDAISQNALTIGGYGGQARKRARADEDDYFDDDDEKGQGQLEYIPAPGSPSYKKQEERKEDSDSEEDPLDAFMAGIEKEVKKDTVKVESKKEPEKKGVRTDIDNEDNEESYYRYMEENPNAGLQHEDSDAEVEYDEDGNPIAPPKSKIIDPLPPMDHSTVTYENFEKNFYIEHEDIHGMSRSTAIDLRSKLGLKVTGPSPPKPVTSFGHFNLDEGLMKVIRKSEYTQPTPIQSQAVPTALSGRDIIGIAKTGSGKTAAFVIPMIAHIMDQRPLKKGEGPIALILAPTRELSQQIYQEAKKFGKAYNLQVVCCYGGGSKWEQSQALEGGAEIIVATPGRMIDMVKMKATNLQRVTYLVLDEADRMFDMGFEPQVRSICNHVRPDRQTQLYSATFKKRVEKLARDILTDPVRIVQGDVGEANQDVTQIVKLFNTPQAKWTWLLGNLVEFQSAGSVLIFVTKKANAEEVANNLRLKENECLLLHGDMDQAERNKVITAFKRKEVNILVATDVAARGLDIPHIRTVVNYDIARDIDTHTHRIGRTGRAGEKGTAYTFVTDKDKEFVGHLVRNLEGANQEVPDDLMELAMQSSWFRNSRFKGGKGKNANVGGRGLGFKERSTGGGGGGGGGGYSAQPKESVSEKIAKSAGPGTDRLSSMRNAFKQQYQSQFKASNDQSWKQHLPTNEPSSSSGSSSSSGEKKKRSRWE
ncbi:ATP-dependent RNA helicase DDX42 [Neocloeon triangulifer]|uniref:ATP-dependent RNA helicase DDX42 n=1 Tax=Neocloeon triangulifer TaxID=2078957 RepID=UPI00286F0585|nr:ATP-dependent RNA helicase DDX42 [Neocloeon triangulifer]